MPPAPRPAPDGPSGPPKSADDFFARVRAVNLVPEAALAAAQAARPYPDATSAAAALRDAGLLTTFQAKKLLAGYAHGFWLDRYRILDHLGTGATSQVFLADHPTLDRRVTIKVLSANPAASVLERFNRETRVAASLDHPHIVQAYDAVNNGTVTYLVMEYVPGETLAQRVARTGSVPCPEACGLIAQAAAGLDHAHQAGLVHRDVKPANLIVTPDNRVKVLDLGLVLVPGCQLNLTALNPGAMLGTPDYVAPEQARNGHAVDARADIYSLGCTLYHILSGSPPFPSKSLADKLISHQTSAPKPVRELAPGVPDGVVKVLDKMMAKKPDDRYQSAAEVCDALLPFADRPERVAGRAATAADDKPKSGWRLWGR